MAAPTLTEVFERADRERWPRMALVNPGEREDEGRIGWLRRRGWSDPYIVVVPEPVADPADVVARLTRLRGLRELVVDYPRVGDVGAQAIAEHLTALTSLDLSGNKIGDVGAQAIAEHLTALTSLDLYSNNIGDAGARAIAEHLTALTSLDLGFNNIGDAGAQAIAEHLTALTSLHLSFNIIGYAGVRAIAEHLTALTSLDLRENNIGDAGARAIAEHLIDLTELDLDNNAIVKLPETISGITSLTSLGVANNQLAELPRALLQLRGLRYLHVGGNPLLNLPPELAERESDATRILTWYFNRKRRLNEAKVLMVGQGGVGKTSLVSAVVHGRKADPEERKTEKIRIDTWTIPSRHDGEKLRVNVWDFGGQEIMHATHQFFLTKRSVYVLVLDARQGEIEGNIHYWLQTIQSFGGDSPVLLVTNKVDVQPLSLNENGLRKQYDPMKIAFHGVSCSTLAGIDGLKEALAETIRGLAHVDDELPEAYFSVKAKLETAALEQHYVDMPEYEKLCEAEGVSEGREQRRLLRFLHDLGTVLNFDDPESPYQVGETNILNPEWVTEGVYAIINNNTLSQAQGQLELRRLPEILKDPVRYPRDKQRFIVEMMRKFELCFDYAGRPDTLLVPELLSKNEPDVNWKDPRECLNFEYGYEVLPTGLLPRFIVRTHHALTDRPTFWRSGVVLSIDGCKVLVRGDSRAKAVRVSVDGRAETRRSALGTVRDVFKAIHATIPRLKVEERVPIPDVPEVAVPYAHLLDLEELSRANPAADDFIPQGLPKSEKRTYSARQILSGIDASFARQAPPPVRTAPAEDALAPPRQRPEPERASVARLAGLAFVFLVLLAGTGVAIVAELRFLDDWASRLLALGVTLLLAVVAFVFLSFFSGLIPASMAERMLGGVMAKVPVLGQRGGGGTGTKATLAEPKPKTPPKALKPAPRKAAQAPEAPQLEAQRKGERRAKPGGAKARR